MTLSTLTLLKEYAPDLSKEEKLQFQSEFSLRSRKTSTGVLLALLLGGVGAHKFWLGQTGSGVVYLIAGTVGWFLILPPIIIAILCIVDACNMNMIVGVYNREVAKEIAQEMEALK